MRAFFLAFFLTFFYGQTVEVVFHEKAQAPVLQSDSDNIFSSFPDEVDWQMASLDHSSLPCNIERRTACAAGKNGTLDEQGYICLTESEFNKYYLNRQPIIIAGLTKNWKALTKWASKQAFLKSYGDLEVPLSTAEEISSHKDVHIGTRSYPLKHAVRAVAHDPSQFVFDEAVLDNSEIAEDFKQPRGWLALRDIAPTIRNRKNRLAKLPGDHGRGERWYMLSYGANTGGLGWHVHGPTWLALVTTLINLSTLIPS
jgi:hypothetical protein